MKAKSNGKHNILKVYHYLICKIHLEKLNRYHFKFSGTINESIN